MIVPICRYLFYCGGRSHQRLSSYSPPVVDKILLNGTRVPSALGQLQNLTFPYGEYKYVKKPNAAFKKICKKYINMFKNLMLTKPSMLINRVFPN